MKHAPPYKDVTFMYHVLPRRKRLVALPTIYIYTMGVKQRTHLRGVIFSDRKRTCV